MMTTKKIRASAIRPRVRLLVAGVVALILMGRESGRPIAQAQTNPIVVENALPGHTDWDISGAGDPSIQGFTTNISVNTGDTVNFKIKTDAGAYRIDIYRLGYYGGTGARKVATVMPSATLPQSQPGCITDGAVGLVDCGNWAVSASWVSTGAVSGIYIAKPVRLDNGGASHIVFVVRDDTRQADVLVQTSDTTWQAYNQWPGLGAGGASLYCAPANIGLSNAGSVGSSRVDLQACKLEYSIVSPK